MNFPKHFLFEFDNGMALVLHNSLEGAQKLLGAHYAYLPNLRLLACYDLTPTKDPFTAQLVRIKGQIGLDNSPKPRDTKQDFDRPVVRSSPRKEIFDDSMSEDEEIEHKTADFSLRDESNDL